MAQHAVQQRFSFQAALVCFVESLPFGKVLPLAGDGTIAGMVTIWKRPRKRCDEKRGQ